LAARIGQTLLSKNKELTTRGDTLEDQLGHASDKVHMIVMMMMMMMMMMTMTMMTTTVVMVVMVVR
jgi:hypothetical protein